MTCGGIELPTRISESNFSRFWVGGSIGTGGGTGRIILVNYGVDNPTPTSILTGTPTNIRALGIVNGQLYAAGDSASNGRLLVTIGTGLPTANIGGNSPASPITGPTPAGNFNQFVYLDLSPTVAGNDTLYVADDTNWAIRKYSLAGAAWVESGTVGTPSDGYRGLTGYVSSTGTVTLFVTSGATNTGGGTFSRIVDASGYNASISSNNVTPLKTASLASFRGVAVAAQTTAVITSADHATFGAGSGNTFTLTSIGVPVPSFTLSSGTLPAQSPAPLSDRSGGCTPNQRHGLWAISSSASLPEKLERLDKPFRSLGVHVRLLRRSSSIAPRKLGKGGRDVGSKSESFHRNLAGGKPARERLTSGRKRVLRGVGQPAPRSVNSESESHAIERRKTFRGSLCRSMTRGHVATP